MTADLLTSLQIYLKIVYIRRLRPARRIKISRSRGGVFFFGGERVDIRGCVSHFPGACLLNWDSLVITSTISEFAWPRVCHFQNFKCLCCFSAQKGILHESRRSQATISCNSTSKCFVTKYFQS